MLSGLGDRSTQRFGQPRNHRLLLGDSQLREDRQAENLSRRFLGLRQTARAIAERLKAFLQMQRHGIINLASHTGRGELRLDAVTARARYSNRVLVPDMPAARVGLRQY